MSANWHLTQALLRQTLASVSRQTCQDFRVLVVCHDPPSLRPKKGCWTLPTVSIEQAPFSAPSILRSDTAHRDMKRKVALGAARLVQDGCDWIMKLDADDLLARETFAFIENSVSDAVIFRKGLVIVSGSRWHLLETRNFHRVCGSCFAMRRDLIMDVAAGEAAHPLSQFFVSDHHEQVVERCLEHSVRVNYPPFAAACYVQHSDMMSTLFQPAYRRSIRELVGRLRRLRRTTATIREQFAIGYG
jgi:hypothetical protein